MGWLSVPFSVGEEGYRDWRLDASSNSKDFLWITRAWVISAELDSNRLIGGMAMGNSKDQRSSSTNQLPSNVSRWIQTYHSNEEINGLRDPSLGAC